MRAFRLTIAFAAMFAAAACGDSAERVGICGDGVVDTGEACDDGSANSANGPCTTSCQFACTADSQCGDGNACDGAETCTNHVCKTGTAIAEGGSCGDAKVCHSNTCVPITCGDGKMDTGEECDDGAKNGTANDGCTAACKFTCVSTDSTRNCALADECQGVSSCNDTTHVCSTPESLPDDTACGGGAKYCLKGACTAPVCGNDKVEPGEECETGSVGCRADCAFECGPTHPATECAGTAAACQTFACSADHACSTVADPAQEATACSLTQPISVCLSGACTAPAVCQKFTCEGQSCTLEADASLNGRTGCDPNLPNDYCSNGACTAPVCGNTIIEPGEQCDNGAANGTAGDACAATCQFACISNTDCDDSNACNGVETCTDHACTSGTPLGEGASCSATEPNDFCRAGLCVAPVCGNSAREPGEQCDDGNTLNLDGCDAICKFEPAARVTQLTQRWDTSAFCPANALGAAIAEAARADVIQPTWDIPVADGTQSIVFKFLDLTDLTGQDATFKLGFVNARAAGRTLLTPPRVPVCGNNACEETSSPGLSETKNNCPADCTYDGNHDLDWWYLREATSVDATETPLVQLAGQVKHGQLTAGPGTISLNLLFAFAPTEVKLYNTSIVAVLDPGLSAPLVSSNGTTPGHLASEHLSPTLTTFSTSSSGSMCSAVSLASLFNAPIPELLQGICTNEDASAPRFTSDNRLLDVFVNGCLLFGTPAILPTQPDGSIDGATYTFTVDATTKIVSGCTKNGAPGVLADCLAAATYSSYFDFSSDRVIIKRSAN